MNTNILAGTKNGLTVFLYHDVSDNPSQFGLDYNLTVSNELFRKQINWIKDNYSIISPLALIDNSKLPDNSALITFDDGFEEAFQNGISYLESMKIPSIVFLNLASIEKEVPLISSIGTYLEKNKKNTRISDGLGLKTPFHLNLTPIIYSKICTKEGELNFRKINNYQGKMADLNTLKKWEDSGFTFYGNHLYEHWNSQALTNDEFEFQFKENRDKLSVFKNSIDFFSFPNGQPELCFSERHIVALRDFGCKKIFFSSGAINHDRTVFLFNRMDLTTYEYNKFKLFYRVIITQFKNKFLKRVANLLRRF